MLELRPNCEYCDIDLPPNSKLAYICSYECTFCKNCVESILRNVCPNCGGGFEPRPVRPQREFRPGVSLSLQTASTKRVHTTRTLSEIDEIFNNIKDIRPEDR